MLRLDKVIKPWKDSAALNDHINLYGFWSETAFLTKSGDLGICASIRLDEVTATQVDQYAAFIHASADDVVDKALNYVFSKDRDFQDFLKTPQARQVASTLRVRRVPSNGKPEEPAKKLATGVESTPSTRVLKA